MTQCEITTEIIKSGESMIEMATISVNGKSYTEMGATVDPINEIVTGYIRGNDLTTFGGEVFGTIREISRWKINSPYSTHMCAFRAIVNGCEYYGRGMGGGNVGAT